MHPGGFIDKRFEIDALVGVGGMGQVFRARDRHTDELVAVKVLHVHGDAESARFVHETRALSKLSHPNIVRYTAHGVTDDGLQYLAMEWLEGEDLANRLKRGRLNLEESFTLARLVADAIRVAHDHGIVHRDLKPSNIFLVRGGIDQAKVLDFGIASLGGVTRVTRTGTIIGTPGYMAPEQAQSNQMVDPRADVFSLGCVLFECLTGSPAFAGETMMAVLAKVLFAEPPRLKELHPELPIELDHFVARLLAKDPAARIRDGAAVISALDEFHDLAGAVSAGRGAPVLTSSERRTISVVLIPAKNEVGGAKYETKTIEDADAEAMETLRRGAETWGGQLEYLRDGSVAVAIRGAGLPTDQAIQAARCALWLRQQGGGRSVALATARSDTTGRTVTAEVIDRATKLLLTRTAPPVGPSKDAPAVVIDEVTARLLEGRFSVRESEAGYILLGERSSADGIRTLLGKATPCVGRELELRRLEDSFEECVEEHMAYAVTVIGSAGVGKSRLAQEFMRFVEERHEGVSIWNGRGDPLSVGSVLGLLSQLLRNVCGIRDGEPLETRRAKLSARVAVHVAPGDQQKTAEFLGEIVGAPFPEESSQLLRAARKDAQLMNEHMRIAFLDFLRAECAAAPLLIVIEDLHWGDRFTVQFLDQALRDLRNLHLFVLALARPEISEVFPTLWADRRVHEIQLKPLRKKDSERLTRHVLGDGAERDVVARIVQLSDGNAFYLEELIRATAEGRYADLPETVVAMVQSRLGTLNEPSRRLLRAGAVFGEVFWTGAIDRLLGSTSRGNLNREHLDELVNREIIFLKGGSRFPNEHEYAFRHALVREGAYEMLTHVDRALGHRLAAEWLEQHGEQDPRVLAEHFTKAGSSAQAIDFWHRAGKLAIQRSANTEASSHLANALQLVAHLPEDSERARQEIILRSTLGLALIATKGFGAEDVHETYTRAYDLCGQIGIDEGKQLFPVMWGLWVFFSVRGDLQTTLELSERLVSFARREGDPALILQAHHAMGDSLFFPGEFVRSRYHLEEAIRLYDYEQHRALAFVYGGYDPCVACLSFASLNLWFLGYPEQALQSSQKAIALAMETEHPLNIAFAMAFASSLHKLRVEPERARECADTALATCNKHNIGFFRAFASIVRGWAMAQLGNQTLGTTEIVEGLAAYRGTGADLETPYWLSLVAEVHERGNRHSEALGVVDEALAMIRSKNSRFFCESELLRLKGELLLATHPDEHAQSEQCFVHAIETARAQGAKSIELRATVSLCRLWQERGKQQEAREMLRPTLEWFTEGLELPDVQNARSLLRALEESRG